jgi:hypothetical protein
VAVSVPACSDPVTGAFLEFLASQDFQVKKSGVTLDATKVAADGNGDKIVKAGTPLQKDGATGKYYPAIADATNAANAVGLMHSGDVNLRFGDLTVGVFIRVSVITARVPGASNGAVLTALKGAAGLKNVIWQ